MGWLTKLSPNARHGLTTLQPTFSELQVRDCGEGIRHGRWMREAGISGTLVEDMFVNPDTASPVAGILVVRHINKDGSYRTLDMEAIFRQGRAEEGIKSFSVFGISTIITSSIHTTTQTGMQACGLSFDARAVTIVADLSGRDAATAESQLFYTQRVREVMKTLVESNFISDNPSTRQAFVNTIQNQFATDRATLKSEPKLLKR